MASSLISGCRTTAASEALLHLKAFIELRALDPALMLLQMPIVSIRHDTGIDLQQLLLQPH